uniref:BMERB domain-containing protein n=1 Tax=Globodera pallida TaxID=36090 RepID=A0A183BZ34_GLOPA
MDLGELAVELEDTLNLRQDGAVSEEDWLFVPDDSIDKSPASKASEEKQNLEKWLRGAVEKVDFRTRSALSRRLEKKKRRADKEKRLRNNNNLESSLSMIEEVSSESGPMSDREQRMRPREKENMAARKAISEASVCSDDEVEDEEDDDEYFDAPSTPKKTPQLANLARNHAKQLLPGGILLRPGISQALAETNGPTTKSVGVAKGPRRNARTIQQQTRRQIQMQLEEDEGVQNEVLVEWRDLGDIERRAKEQERELQMELMRDRCQRLGNTIRETHTGGTATTTSRSRPDSDSSSTSSILSGANASGCNALSHSHLATSKSVDFRSSSGHIADHSSIASSRSNEGSLADLSCSPSPSASPHNSWEDRHSFAHPEKVKKQSLPSRPEQMDDEECF